MVALRGRARWFPLPWSGEAGYSLAELLVVTVVSLLVVGGAVMVSKQVQEGYGQQLETAAAEQEARYALDWIQRTIRQAGSNPFSIRTSACVGAGLLPSVNGFPPLVRDPNGNGIDDDVRVLADASPSNGLLGGPGPAPGGCTEPNEDVTISYSAANRNITLADRNQPALGAQVMTDNVITSLRFVYRDRNRALTADMARVAWVQVTLGAQGRLIDPHTGLFPTYNVSVDVRLRPRW